MTKPTRQTKYGIIIPQNLTKNLHKHLKPIEYDRWAKLAFSEDLTEEEAREKEDIERKNLNIVEKIYKELKEDDGVMETIEQIKGHEWVKVVEGE